MLAVSFTLATARDLAYLVAIAGFVVYLAYRYMRMRVWHAILCTIFGFLLAATSAAPQINHLLTTLVQWLQRP